jgi:putative NADH-flavin reductase
MAKKKTTPAPDLSEKPRVHKELEGFDIKINSFGEINSSINIDKLNEFLNKHVDDKKLRKGTEGEEDE